jgi:hypothetical protein
VTLSNYRWRLGLEKGERKYDSYEQKLATLPNITVPTITIEGGNNGAPHPAPQAYAGKFTGKYEHRTFGATVGTIRLRKIRRISLRRSSTRTSSEMCYFQYVTLQSGDFGGAY